MMEVGMGGVTANLDLRELIKLSVGVKEAKETGHGECVCIVSKRTTPTGHRYETVVLELS